MYRTPIVFFFGLSMLLSCAQIPQTTQAKLDSLFIHVSDTAPGYILGVIQDTSFLFQKGYGLANLTYDIPITKDAVFNVASLSKQFTAACVALLKLDGKLSLNDPVSQYVDNWPTYSHEVQLKHLIYMTSGIPEYYQQERPNGTDWSSLQFFSVDSAIRVSLARAELDFVPGTQWAYSNVNYMLLTKVVEQVSGMPFALFARKRLFEPLGMLNTYVADDLFQVIPNQVIGYNFRDADNTDWMVEAGYLPPDRPGFLQIHRHSPHYGGSGVYTSLADFKKWLDNFETRAFGGDAFYELMHQTMQFEHDKTNDAFGLVWGDFNGEPMVWYEGGDWGFSSYFMRFPAQNLSVVCFSNLGTGYAVRYAHRAVDVLMDAGVIQFR